MFQFYGGLDILDWFRDERPWPQLMRLSHKLPSHSRYKAALIQDEEWAEAVTSLVDFDDEKPQVTAEEWTREQDTLAAIYDMLQSVRQVLVAANSSSSGPPVHPMPRPRSAIDRARERAVKQRHNARVSAMTTRKTEE